MDRSDERIFVSYLEAIEIQKSRRLVRKGTYDRSIFIVGEGRVKAFGRKNVVTYSLGSVFGHKYFMMGGPWEEDIVGCGPGYVFKLSLTAFNDLQEVSGKAAASVWKRITK